MPARQVRARKDLALLAVRGAGQALAYCSNALRDDDEVVHAAVSSDGFALEYAS